MRIMFPLTNTRVPFEKLERLVKDCAEASGQNVIAQKGPMPRDERDPDHDYYDPALCADMNSIWASEADCSLFWREWDKRRAAYGV